MSSVAEAGYGQVRKQTADPRKIERHVLLTIASDMEAADPSNLDGYQALARALERNTQLWTAFIMDLANAENDMDKVLKAELAKLARFSIVHARRVLNGEGDVTPLVSVNRTIAAGLKPVAEAA